MRQISLCALSILLLISQPLRSETVQLWPLSDTSPDHVYAVWVNINKLLAAIGSNQDPNWRNLPSLNRPAEADLLEITPRKVLGLLSEFRSILDKELEKNSNPLGSTRQVSIGGALEPHVVFVNSLEVLDAVKIWEQSKFSGVLSFREYFLFDIPKGKTPPDVAILVEQAIAKLEYLANI